MAYIILDRDGVINYDSDEYIKSPNEWVAIPGSLAAIATLNRAGFKVLIATNQSGISRQLYDIATLDLIHKKFIQELQAHGGHIEEIFFCPHHPEDHCLCRKPKPGLLQEMQKKYTFAFAHTFFIGDSNSDVAAALAVGCQPLLVLTGKGSHALATYPHLNTIPNFANLAEAVNYVVDRAKENNDK